MAPTESAAAVLGEKLRADGMSAAVVDLFLCYYQRLRAGARGEIGEAEIEPPGQLLRAEDLGCEAAARGRELLSRTVLVKLNGGLGTGMGLDQAKSLLPVKDGLTFLDIIARQALSAGVPLLLMNSFATRADSLARLAAYPELNAFGLPSDFLQHRIPRLCAETLAPVRCPEEPQLEWCPPGHGDLYPALFSSGVLARLLAAGYRYAFVSNADNLGAVLDEAILGYFAASRAPFLLEVAERTAADRKGGHLARRPGGGLILREAAQCPAADLDAFQDIKRYRYFNTNSLWLDLHALQDKFSESGGLFELPLIVNRKTLDSRDPASRPVLQLETAMGAAIEVFAGAQALQVPRFRFAPVKTTDDLLAVRSDAYELGPDFRVALAPGLQEPPLIELDPACFCRLDDFERRFAAGVPSLKNCSRLRVAGDVSFGADITLAGCLLLKAVGGVSLTLPTGLWLSDLAADKGEKING